MSTIPWYGADGMPQKNKLPEWEKEDNRTMIFSKLFERSMTFTEIRKETRLAKSTLSNHLKDLQEFDVIEKALENDRVVYRTTNNEEVIMAEFMKADFNFILDILLDFSPNAWLLLTLYLKAYIKTKMIKKQREIEGLTKLTDEEILDLIWPEVDSEFTKEELEKFKRVTYRPGVKIATKLILRKIRDLVFNRARDDATRIYQEEIE